MLKELKMFLVKKAVFLPGTIAQTIGGHLPKIPALSQAAFISTKKTVRTGKKQSPNSYALFYGEHIRRLKAENQGDDSVQASDKLKHAAEAWKSLPFEERKVYEIRARVLQRQAAQEYDMLSREEKEEQIALKQSKWDKKHGLALKKEMKASGKPRGPRSAWNYYIQSENFGKGIASARELKASFDTLSDEEKQKYIDMSKEDHERYLYEMEIWVEKVIQEGNRHLVPMSYRKKYW
ncbi:transcription factor A, mitochondrial-like [Watersipora subatra]|uniref:transcription factor A, mitochondrial-like n=1 Tax=Watersipora subatra TaxID=2589382 RepID=UPI00355B7540